MIIRFGTNINHSENYEQAKRLLIDIFGSADFSTPEYSRDYNAKPDDTNVAIYLNFRCHVSTDKPIKEVSILLKKAETQMGRTKERKAKGIIDADFDIIED